MSPKNGTLVARFLALAAALHDMEKWIARKNF